jgi:hypothetical protein
MAKLESHFFKHDVTAKDDQKILELRADHGAEGYGLYWMMVETMYTSGGDIDRGAIGGLSLGYGVPKDTLLAIMNRCTELGLLIEIDEGKLTSKRVQEAIGDRRQASINGKKGAEKRWKNKKTDGDPNGVAIGLPCLPHDDPNGKERRGEDRREENKTIYDFEIFWTAFDKKTEKKQAKAQWAKMSDENKAKALDSVADYVKSTPDVQYRKSAFRWLRDERFNDEVPQEPNPLDAFNDGELAVEDRHLLFPTDDEEEDEEFII